MLYYVRNSVTLNSTDPSREWMNVNSPEDTTQALETIHDFLRRDPNWWVWESLIEAIMLNTSRGDNSRKSEAVFASAYELRLHFKTPEQVRRADPRNVWEIIQWEFKQLALLPADRRYCHGMLQTAYSRAADFIGPSADLKPYLTQILQKPRRQYAAGVATVKSCVGVYGLWARTTTLSFRSM